MNLFEIEIETGLHIEMEKFEFNVYYAYFCLTFDNKIIKCLLHLLYKSDGNLGKQDAA